MSTRKERLYLVQALRAYSVTTPGQFDKDTVTRPQITQDAADEIAHLEKLLGDLRRAVQSHFGGFGPEMPESIAEVVKQVERANL